MERSTLTQIIIPVLILVLFVVGIFGVLRLRNSSNQAQPPTLDVNVQDNTVTSADKLDISGTTSAEELTIDSNKVDIATDGTFTYQVPLAAGSNTVTFSATKDGKTTEFSRTVTRKVAVSNAPDNLSSSGPAENIGIVGLTGLVFAIFYYLRSRKNGGSGERYKLFTNSRF